MVGQILLWLLLLNLVVVLVAGFYLVYLILGTNFHRWRQQRRVEKKAAGAVAPLVPESRE